MRLPDDNRSKRGLQGWIKRRDHEIANYSFRALFIPHGWMMLVT